MKRVLSLLTCVAMPVAAFAADAQASKSGSMSMSADKMNSCWTSGPTSAMNETWADRTYFKVGFTKSSSAFYSLNTIQPLYRDADMDNTVFVQAGIGAQRWHRSTDDIGLGYRYLTHGGGNMFGISFFYFDNTRTHHHHQPKALMKKNGLGFDLSWHTRYTTVNFGRYHNVHSMTNRHTWTRYLDFNKATTSLDLRVQVPYLPWTQLLIGKRWHDGLDKLNHLDYGLQMNIAGPLAVQMGYQHGWSKNGYVNFVFSFGRPAVREYTLSDALYHDELFTARDLKDYTLDPVMRPFI